MYRSILKANHKNWEMEVAFLWMSVPLTLIAIWCSMTSYWSSAIDWPIYGLMSDGSLIVHQWRRGRGGGRGGPWPPYCKIEPDTQVTPVVETRQKIVNVVGIFVVKHWKKCYGNREKCHESKCNVIVRKIFLPKKLSTGGGGFKMLLSETFFPHWGLSEKYCPKTWEPRRHCCSLKFKSPGISKSKNCIWRQ
jgi:hypothetical protein